MPACRRSSITDRGDGLMLKTTQWSIAYTYVGRDAEVYAHGDCIRAFFRDPKYTVVKLTKEMQNVCAGHFYRASYQYDSENICCYVYYIWHDANGTELLKGYLQSGDRIISPENAETLTIEVLLTGKGVGSLQLTDLKISAEGICRPRNVRVCAVAYELLNRELAALPFEENVALTLREIDVVAKDKPDVIVLTENAFQTSEKISESGTITPNRLDDRHVQALCGKAKEYGCYIVASLRTVDKDDTLHNTCILIDRMGKIQGISHKTHLTINEKERGIEPGTELPVFDTDFGRIGMLVCWEHFFPEAVRTLALKGAELVLVPTHGFRLDRAAVRAMENGIYLVTAHVRGDCSVILDQDGQVIADGKENGYAMADIDMNRKAMVRYLSCASWADPNNIYRNQRRPDLYKLLTL